MIEFKESPQIGTFKIDDLYDLLDFMPFKAMLMSNNFFLRKLNNNQFKFLAMVQYLGFLEGIKFFILKFALV